MGKRRNNWKSDSNSEHGIKQKRVLEKTQRKWLSCKACKRLFGKGE